ncbi:hypothetical protein BBJ28_00019022 [Nothophytophthora sp. Chile5]|nr:hypothetical protein BBJ28_00019022 [Nothophytophthora sp. Chile5]
MILCRFFCSIAALAAILSSSGDALAPRKPRVDPGVHRTLRQQATVNLMVTMHGGTGAALAEADVLASSSASGSDSTSRGARIVHLVDSLETLATSAQRPVAALLAQEADSSSSTPHFSSSTRLWITNQLFIADASVNLLQKLMAEPSIAEIREELVLTMGDDLEIELLDGPAIANTTLTVNAQAWGIEKIGTAAVWDQGFTGQNVTIATIDSGVRVTHEALRGNFLGDYGWFDPGTKRATPYDSSGHGSHVTGSIVGAQGIGVAPGAQWMACRGCSSATSCLESELLACAQFVLCPTDPAGENADCSKAPHVVNNSWGVTKGSADFSAVIAAWRAADIIPVFANGNSGSTATCSTVVSPADASNVIGVGASSSDDSLLAQSSTGPASDGRIKPDLTAPGVSVYSAWWTRDNIYAITSGTSMAAPHVAGAVALLLSARPELSYDEIWTVLTNSTARDEDQMSATGHATCGNISISSFPNNLFGYGRLNIQQAIASLLSD